MGTSGSSVARGQTRRPTSVRGPAGSTARHIVCVAERLRLAPAAARSAPLADCVHIFPALDPGRHRGPHPGDLAAGGAGRRGPKPDPQRRYHRQSVYENHGKRGPLGYDAGQKVTGRKRHIIVDTIGLLLTVVVHPADMQDRDGAQLVMHRWQGRCPRLRLIWADAGYAGQLNEWVRTRSGWTLEIVKRPPHSHQFEVLPRRWVVERTFAWLGRCRRLSKDFEALCATTEAWINIAMIQLMLRRLAPV